MGIQFRYTSFKNVREYIDSLPEEVFDEAKQAFDEASIEAYNNIINRVSGYPLKVGSGKLRSSIKRNIEGTSISTIRTSITSNSPYIKTHEFGATIKAKNKYMWLKGGPYMNIPTKENMNNGLVVYSSRTLFNYGAKIRTSSQGFGIYSAGIRMFNLVKQVKINPTLKFRETALDSIPTLLSKLQQLMLRKQ